MSVSGATEQAICIRDQNGPDDIAAIKAVNAAAFAGHGATVAFDDFRAERSDIISLVADSANGMLGHVLFSPVRLKSPSGEIDGMGLAQLAVRPECQGQGIGTRLANAGIEILRSAGCRYIVVIGHAGYYPRFGFEPGSRYGIRCQWENVPDETFMVMFPSGTGQSVLRGVATFDGL